MAFLIAKRFFAFLIVFVLSFSASAALKISYISPANCGLPSVEVAGGSLSSFCSAVNSRSQSLLSACQYTYQENYVVNPSGAFNCLETISGRTFIGSITCTSGGTYNPTTHVCDGEPQALDCSGQAGTYADCGAQTCRPYPTYNGGHPPDPNGVPAETSPYVCQPGESNSYCDFGNECTDNGGILAWSDTSAQCGGLPSKCDDATRPPVLAFNNNPAPDFPEPGQVCAEVQPGYVICAKNSPDKPSGEPDGHYKQGNGITPGGPPGGPGDNTGSGNGDTTNGDGYDDDDGDGVPDGLGGPGGGGGGGGGTDMSGVIAGLDKIHGDLSGTFSGGAGTFGAATVNPSAGPNYQKTDKTYQSVYDGFKGRINSSDIVSTASGVFNVSINGGACPVWSADVPIFGTITIDAQCSDVMNAIWPIIYAVVVACAVFVGIRWAFL